MDEKQIKRRGWIKNIAIIFLIIMLLLTFFSNTIMNYSLPEVSAQYAWGGTITSKIRTSGVVEANSTYNVTIDDSRTIRGVYVREGDYVDIGALLFTLEDIESDELTNARIDLERMEVEYQKAQLAAGYDYTALENAVAQARAAVTEAENVLASLPAARERYDLAKAAAREAARLYQQRSEELSEIESRIAAIKSTLDGASGDADSLLTAAEAEYSAAKSALNQAKSNITVIENRISSIEDDIEQAQEKIDRYTAILSGGSSDSLGSTLDSRYLELEEAEIALARMREDYDRALAEEEAAVIAVQDERNAAIAALDAIRANENATDEELSAALERADAAETAFDEAAAALEAKKLELLADFRAIEDKERSIDALEDEIDELEDLLSDAENAESRLDKAEDELAAEQKKLSAANDDLEAARSAVTDAQTRLDKADAELELRRGGASLIGLQADKKAAQDMLAAAEDAKEEADNAEAEAKAAAVSDSEAQAAIDSAKRAYDEAKAALEAQMDSDAANSAAQQLDLKLQYAALERQRDYVTELETKTTDAEITAKMAGIVTSISCVAGEDVSAGSTLAVVQVSGKGYSMTLDLTNEQCSRIRVGDTAEITGYWYGNITATVTSMRNNPQNPGRSKNVILTITADNDSALAGMNLSVSLGERGQNYDAVVPTSDIREDNAGKFVLVVISKPSPLGTRYFAERVDVTPIISDETNTAVSGLTGSEFVITTSTAPITAGQQIRMVSGQ